MCILYCINEKSTYSSKFNFVLFSRMPRMMPGHHPKQMKLENCICEENQLFPTFKFEATGNAALFVLFLFFIDGSYWHVCKLLMQHSIAKEIVILTSHAKNYFMHESKKSPVIPSTCKETASQDASLLRLQYGFPYRTCL